MTTDIKKNKKTRGGRSGGKFNGRTIIFRSLYKIILYVGPTRSLKWKSSYRGCQAERVYTLNTYSIHIYLRRILVFYVNILWSGSRTPSPEENTP